MAIVEFLRHFDVIIEEFGDDVELCHATCKIGFHSEFLSQV